LSATTGSSNRTSSDLMEINPLWYAYQVVFFVLGAVIFGYVLRCMISEAANGLRSIRFAWAICLCISSGLFVLLFLDPRGALGLYPFPVIKLIEWAEILSLDNSLAFAGYTYMVAAYRRNRKSVPEYVRTCSIVGSILGTLVHVVLSVVGAATGNLYWFGVDAVVLVIQECLQLLVINVTLHTLSAYLKSLTQEKSTLGVVGTDFNSTLKKMMRVRVMSGLSVACGILIQIALPGIGALERLARPYSPIFVDNTVFVPTQCLSPLGVCGLNCLFLYIIKRPQSDSEKSSMQRPTTATASSRVSRSASTSAPKKVQSLVGGPDARQQEEASVSTAASSPVSIDIP